jgi:alkylation response protein AidB-like acyl-CoA dehydrogenase
MTTSTQTIDYADVRDATRRFTDERIVPIADAIDRDDALLPEPLLSELAELGYFGLHIPLEWGGSGMDVRTIAVVTEELCRGLLSAGSVLGRNLLMGEQVLHDGTDDQRNRFLEGIATGRTQTASAGTEPEAGSDAANISTRAVQDGDRYLLTGTKAYCTFADRADLLFVYARTSTGERKHHGICCFLVEKPAGQFVPPTLTASRIETIGYHGMHTWMLHLDHHPVPAANLLGGEEGRGFYQLMRGYETARIAFAARCVGVTQAALEAAESYARVRVQFDKPIKDFQITRAKVADMATEVEAARQLVWHAATVKDGGGRCDLEAGMAKLFASEVALRHTWTALQIHGGLGYTRDHPVQRFWRDAALLPIAEGTNDMQRQVIARRIFGD